MFYIICILFRRFLQSSHHTFLQVLHELFHGFPWTPFTMRTPLHLDIKALSVSHKMKYFGLRKRESLPPKYAVITCKEARPGKWKMQWRGNIATIMKTSESNYFCTSYSLLNIRGIRIYTHWIYVYRISRWEIIRW